VSADRLVGSPTLVRASKGEPIWRLVVLSQLMVALAVFAGTLAQGTTASATSRRSTTRP